MGSFQLPISGDESVEEIIEACPSAGGWLARRGVFCIECGEVFWGSLNEILDVKIGSPEKKAEILEALNEFLAGSVNA